MTAAEQDRRAIIARLDDTIHQVVGPLVPAAGRRFALIDFPDHGNVGDSAIWAGEAAYFARRHNTRPSFVYGFGSRDIDWDKVLRDLGPDGPVFIHGGGNFGDVWPHHHALRMQVLERARGRRVVQLPQSIHFGDPAAIETTAAAIGAHGNVLLLVRDRPSFDLASARFPCEVRLCPDMAFSLGDLARRGAPRHKVLMLARNDHEAVAATAEDPSLRNPDVVRADWTADPEGFRASLRRETALRSLLTLGPLRAFDRDAQRELLYRRLADARVERGLALLSQGQAVATDRLHAHILCLLLGIPHAVADNHYGKIARFMDAWGTDGAGVRRTGSLAEAAEAALDLAG